MTEIISVAITTATRTEAEKIGRALLAEKLAACINILPPVFSMYTWNGRAVERDEIRLIAVTRASLFEPLRKLAKALHSYECPCIVATAILNGHQPYLQWVAGETST